MPEYGKRITHEGFHEKKLAFVRVEVEDNIMTNNAQLPTDLIKCLKLLQQHLTPKLTLTIHMDDKGHPMRITRSYVERQERFR